MINDCIFCKIAGNQLPYSPLYEDDDVIAFMDINPVAKGHALIIPRSHHQTITDTPTLLLQKVIVVVQSVATAVHSAVTAAGISISQANGSAAGQAVPHIHFHVIPRSEGSGGHRCWTPGCYDSTQEMDSYAERIRTALEQQG